MSIFKKIVLLILSLTLVACSTNVFNCDSLIKSIEESTMPLIVNGEDASSRNDYIDGVFEYEEVDLPSSYDLRDKGLVTSIKNQGDYGTCWAHGIIAASEIEVLRKENLTNEEYIAKYGSEPDFSEKALSFYTTASSEEKEEKFIFEIEDISDIYNFGSNCMFSISNFVNGIGLHEETDYPYCDEDGEIICDETWNLDFDETYNNTYVVNDISILPSPSQRDDNGNYVFNEDAVNEIKKQLVSDKAVVIAYHADNIVAPKTYSEVKELLWDLLINEYKVSEEYAEYYIKFRSGILNLDTLTDEEIDSLITFRLEINEFHPQTYDLEELSREEKILILGSEYFGYAAEDVIEYEKEQNHFLSINPISGDFTHYTYKSISSNHMVTIVGYDDDYSATNFNSEHTPAGDGAFIAKNSWSDQWGNDGYFYLSYYDMSLEQPFVLDISKKDETYEVLTNANAQFMDICSTYYDDEVLEANILNVEKDSDIYLLKSLTDNFNTTVDYEIYKLNDNYKNPTDGELIYSHQETYKYSGMHSLYLDEEIKLSKGETISVVTKQVSEDRNILINTYGFSKEYLDDLSDGTMTIEHDLQKEPTRYVETKIPSGTSYLSIDGGNNWYDWSDVVKELKENSDILEYDAIDNLPISVYITSD